MFMKIYDQLLRSCCNFYLYAIDRWFIKYQIITCEHIYEIKLVHKTFFQQQIYFANVL